MKVVARYIICALIRLIDNLLKRFDGIGEALQLFLNWTNILIQLCRGNGLATAAILASAAFYFFLHIDWPMERGDWLNMVETSDWHALIGSSHRRRHP